MARNRKQIAAIPDERGTTVSMLEAVRGATVEVVSKVAFEAGADIVVTGAFGYSRFYDFAIGTTSTVLLEGITISVLFSR